MRATNALNLNLGGGWGGVVLMILLDINEK